MIDKTGVFEMRVYLHRTNEFREIVLCLDCLKECRSLINDLEDIEIRSTAILKGSHICEICQRFAYGI